MPLIRVNINMTNSIQPIISIENLSVNFGNTPTVRNVSLSISAGEMLALVGESGSGKSVTALSILRLLPYPLANHPSGVIRFKNVDLLNCDDNTLRRIRGNDISMIFQEPMTSLNPLHTIEKQIGEVLRLHKRLDEVATRARTIELLMLVEIASPETRLASYPHELSGGQRQRVMIAMALANDPQLLIADEPTTALDVTIEKQVLSLLKSLQQKLNMSILLITHDLNLVKHYADNVAVMHQGEIVEMGTANTVFASPKHEYTQQLLGAIPHSLPYTPAVNAPILLSTKNLKVWFPIKKGIFKRTVDYIKAINKVDISIKQGYTLGIVGESGSGKTTLGLALLRLIKSDGAINFNGNRIDTLSQDQLRPLRREIQMVFQDPFGSLSPRLSISEIIGEGLDVHKIAKNDLERDALICSVLEEVGMDPSVRHRYPHEFSGGQRQRVAIARALILKPKLIVFDEPTSALDRTIQVQIIDLLNALQSKYQLSYLFISHDLAVIKALSHDVVVMKDGNIVEYGAVDQIMNNPQHPYTKDLMAAAF
jgi:microcin C transport system ATP-binding protein